MFALRFGAYQILLSNAIDSESRILFLRNIRERVQKLAPFLSFDRDPYLVVADGRLFWMYDAYTTSARYPYSTPSGGLNYIRNAVKIVIDAYHGSTTFYLADEEDSLHWLFKQDQDKDGAFSYEEFIGTGMVVSLPVCLAVDGAPAGDRVVLGTQRLKMLPLLIEQARVTELVVPGRVYSDTLSLDSPGRRIEIRYLGRGNTDGDSVVFLPDDGVVITGDLVVMPLPFGFYSYPGDWARTLETDEDRLREAVRKVGPTLEKVKRELGIFGV